MSKNISKIIKDTLKLISVGIFISMNGMPVNSFAMDDGEADRTRPSSPSLILDDGEALRNLFKESTTLLDLPDEVIKNILSFLGSKDLNTASLLRPFYKARCTIPSEIFIDSERRLSLTERGNEFPSWAENRPIGKITSFEEAPFVLRVLPQALANISGLRVLCLRNNCMMPEEMHALELLLQQTPNLEVLDLESNAMVRREIENEGGLRILESLSMPLSKLHTLNLNHHVIRPQEERVMENIYKFFPNLRILCLHKTGLGSGAAKMLLAFKHLPNLEVLDLSFNFLEDYQIEILSSVLPHVPRLRILNLNANILNEHSSQGIKALAEALRHISNLEVLDLRYNSIRHQGGGIIARALHNVPNLRALHLNLHSPASTSGNPEIVSLRHFLRDVPHLRILDLASSGLEGKDITVLASDLQHLPHLHTLDLSFNKLRDQGVEALVASNLLRLVPSLCTLNLRGNSIGNAGIEFLAPVLHQFPNLEALNLSDNRIGLERVARLEEEILLSSPNLRLNLSNQTM